MTKSTFELTDVARQDLAEIVLWLRANAGEEVAARFAAATNGEFERLGLSPGIGTPVEATRLTELRKWRVAGFPSHLIFYAISAGGVTVVRVLHSARDWERVLLDDLPS